MSTPSDQEAKVVSQDAPQAGAEELTREEIETLSGGKPNTGSPSCTETSDTGMMGCPG